MLKTVLIIFAFSFWDTIPDAVLTIKAYLRDIPGSVPDHYNKVNGAIK